MSLQGWLNEDKLSPHTTNPKEVQSLFKVIERDIADAEVTAISADRRFATAITPPCSWPPWFYAGFRLSGNGREGASLCDHQLFAVYDGGSRFAPDEIP